MNILHREGGRGREGTVKQRSAALDELKAHKDELTPVRTRERERAYGSAHEHERISPCLCAMYAFKNVNAFKIGRFLEIS